MQKKPSRYQQTTSMGYILLFTNKKLSSQILQPEFRLKTHVYAHDMRPGLCARQAEGLWPRSCCARQRFDQSSTRHFGHQTSPSIFFEIGHGMSNLKKIRSHSCPISKYLVGDVRSEKNTEKLGCTNQKSAKSKTILVSKNFGKNCPISKKLRKNDNVKNETKMGTNAKQKCDGTVYKFRKYYKNFSNLKKKGGNCPVSKKMKYDMGPIFQKLTKIKTNFNGNGTIMCPNSSKEK